MPLGPGMFRDIMRRPGSDLLGRTGKRAAAGRTRTPLLDPRRRAGSNFQGRLGASSAPTPRELPRPSGGVMGPGRSRGQRFGLNFGGGFRGGFDSLRQFAPNLRSYR